MHAARLIYFYIFRSLLLKGAEVIKLSKAGECVCVCVCHVDFFLCHHAIVAFSLFAATITFQ